MTTSTPWREFSLITHHLQRDKVSNYYCCCECGFEHECLGYISEMGEINETIFAKIVQSVVDGKCPHVNAETMEYTKMTTTSWVHISVAVGTKQAVINYGATKI